MNDTLGRILVPTDESEESDAAYVAIMPLVRAYAPEVTVLYVFEDPEASFVTPARIAKACRALRSADVNAHLELREGRPADQILEVARSRKVDLIAISTQGRTGAGRLIWGSVAEAVLRRADLPVLVTRHGANERPWKKIVVAPCRQSSGAATSATKPAEIGKQEDQSNSEPVRLLTPSERSESRGYNPSTRLRLAQGK